MWGMKSKSEQKDEELLTSMQVCEKLQISIYTLRVWKRKGLPYHELAHNVHRFKWADVMKWVDKRKKVRGVASATR